MPEPTPGRLIVITGPMCARRCPGAVRVRTATSAAPAADMIEPRAVCMRCRSLDATLTQRLVGGRPARRGDPEILIGAAETYEARGRRCHQVLD